MAVHHITRNKEIKCKLTCQCVLTNNNSRPKNEGGGGGGEGTDDHVPNPPPLDLPFKVVQIRLLSCTIKSFRESTLGINHNALLHYLRLRLLNYNRTIQIYWN